MQRVADLDLEPTMAFIRFGILDNKFTFTCLLGAGPLGTPEPQA
jgi:hypothetical protein